jgi:uncharacterized membrane protein (UPF0127 family)
MPVLVEMTSVVAATDRLRAALGPGVDASSLGARWLVDDGLLTALSFVDRGSLEEGLRQLARAGLLPVRGGEPADLAIVDQHRGPWLWWPWLELAVVHAAEGGPLLAARRSGSERLEVAVPPGWSHPRSASARLGVEPLAIADRPLQHLRREPGCDLYVDGWTGSEVRLERADSRVQVRLEAPGGGSGVVHAELVTRWEEIEVGLMFRDALPPDEGMLFRFQAPGRHGFWMKNTRLALDILFVGGDGRVVNVAERAAPLRLRQHLSRGPVVEVLEVPGGWCAAHGVGAGARIEVARLPFEPGSGPAPRPWGPATRAR